MAFLPMYEGINNSIPTSLSSVLSATDTTILLDSVANLPNAPNLATIGAEDNAELIRYNAISDTMLTGCERGFNGTLAQVWPAGTMVYRAHTAYDQHATKENIEQLEGKVSTVYHTLPDEDGDVSPAAEKIPVIDPEGNESNVQAQFDALWARSGGSLSIVVASELPVTVPDRTIVVIVDNIATDTIASPHMPELVTGRVWVQLEPKGEHTITASGDPVVTPVKAWQCTSGEWIARDGYYAFYGEWAQFSSAYTIMGYQWNYSNSSPLLTRIEAAEGLAATASVGTVAGSSDFDAMPIYRDIRRCNLAANGAVNAYEGDTGFSYTGSNGDVMVEIPKFWYKVEVDTTLKTRKFMIADGPVDGFSVYPLFDRGDGVVRKKAYIGAYETGAAYTSKSGVAPLVSQTRAATRTGVKAKAAGWSIQDLTARLALAELFRVEYATMNAQAAIGLGQSNSTNTAALATGRTNSIAGHTGREAGTDGATSVVYRGIENPWGNVFEFVDGFNINGGVFHYCLNQDNFADDTATNYTALSFTIGTALSAVYATGLGLDDNATWAAVPSSFSGGSGSTYLTDACWSGAGWRVALASGGWRHAENCGLSLWQMGDSSAASNALYGSRMMYTPAS